MRKECTLDVGVYDPELPKFKEERDALRRKAEKLSSELGHKLGPWTFYQSSMCRQCGQVVRLPNLYSTNHGMTVVSEDIEGFPIRNKCSVHLDMGDSKWPERTEPEDSGSKYS